MNGGVTADDNNTTDAITAWINLTMTHMLQSFKIKNQNRKAPHWENEKTDIIGNVGSTKFSPRGANAECIWIYSPPFLYGKDCSLLYRASHMEEICPMRLAQQPACCSTIYVNIVDQSTSKPSVGTQTLKHLCLTKNLEHVLKGNYWLLNILEQHRQNLKLWPFLPSSAETANATRSQVLALVQRSDNFSTLPVWRTIVGYNIALESLLVIFVQLIQ